MSSIQKIRTYVYDTPATYDQFDGGINTNLSNEALEINELRDGLNCHYINKSLVNRRGEKIIKKLNLPIKSRPQGDFMYSAKNNTYIISVRNGHIFYGIYDSSDIIDMNLMEFNYHETTNRDDSDNVNIDLLVKDEVNLDEDTEGFIYRYLDTGESDDEEDEFEDEDEDYHYSLIIQNTRRVQGVPTLINMNPHNDPSINYKDEDTSFFVMATGLRILRIEEVGNELIANTMEAYLPNSWEIQNIGVNNLSPFPNHYVDDTDSVPKTSIGQILTNPKVLAINNIASGITATTKVNCLYGYEKEDLYYKWEARFGADSPWKVIWFWKSDLNPDSGTSKGKTSITISQADLLKINDSNPITAGNTLYIRCTLTSDFQYSYSLDDDVYTKDLGESEYNIDGLLKQDFVADESIAQYSKTHITRTVASAYYPEETDPTETGYIAPDDQFLKMHSCTKVVTDGTKLLFYDDIYNSCEWYKTVVGVPNYISYGGNLSFRTNKNEKIIGVVVFDSNILVFSDNETLGGNISVVTGNGDDYNDGDYYSPYKRKIVNTNVSCDAYNTIQVAENYVIFKYRRDIYMLDTNDLDSERVQVITINDKVKQRLNNVEFPLDRIREPMKDENLEYDFHEYNKCLKPDEIFSEVCDGYYGIVFPNQGFHIDTFEFPDNALKYYEGVNPEYIERLKGRKLENISAKPGLRWKCYFRNEIRYSSSSKTFYPWLRDVSKYLNICNIIDINGESTMITKDGLLVQFNNEDYDGLDEYNYKVRVATKCYDMELPTLCKFMDNLNVYYNRDFTDTIDCKMYVKNEADYYIYTPNEEAFVNTQNNLFGEVKYNERYKVDDALNLLPGYEPIEQYDEKPYVDPMDKPVQILDQTPLDTATLNRPQFTSVTLTPRHRFPFLSAQFILEMRSNQAFSLSALTFSFTSNDMPDFTREKLYRDILKGNILK